MGRNTFIFGVITLGLLSSFALIYFYLTQRNFTQNHREFLIHINNLDYSQNHITSTILKNSIFAYNNQDDISEYMNSIEHEIQSLLNSKILSIDSYKKIKDESLNLQQKTQKFLLKIEEYSMLNAGIKNSLVFLTNLIDTALELNAEDKSLYIPANQIVSLYKNSNRMQDIDYINTNSYLLLSNSTNPKTQEFVKQFNLHSSYLLKKFPNFIKTTSLILNNTIGADIEKTRDDFSTITLNDFESLDLFALVLFLTFTLSFSLIMILLLKYMKEHDNLIEAKNSLEHSLTYDTLTSLRNRLAFEKDLQTKDKPHLLIINIDGFKHVNDIYGNGVGNELLKELSVFIKNHLFNIQNKKVYRLGGDEFGILFNNENKNYVLEIAYSLENAISNHNFIIGPLKLNLNVSIASNNISPILENADLALKELKKDVNRQVAEYNEALNLKQNVEQNLATINLIKKSIQEDRIVPYFQPIVNLNTLKIEKYESLVRIVQPSGDVLTPFFFLEVSKKTPYYHDITRIMIEKTIEVAKHYQQYRFSINISMRDILNHEITNILFSAFDKNSSVASRIDIELLESEVLEDNYKIQNFITKIHSYGSKILIDDFGTGYSNFSYFSTLDVDIIKIDGSIVSEITTNVKKLHMLKSIYQFSKGMGMINVAEFVETREMALLLKNTGITYAQGYFFGKPQERPLPSETVTL